MKITEIETIQIEEFPNIVYVRIHTNEGIVGLGETFFGANSVAAWIHDTGAAYLLGKDPLQIDKHWMALNPFVGFNSTGIENRARSAIDIALWDILGKICNQPLYQLLGGKTHERIKVYNTCAGPNYVRGKPTTAGLPTSNWGISRNNDESSQYEDLEWFLRDAGELAQSLLSMGIKGMKIWPFDIYAEQSGGHYISRDDLKKGCEPFRKVREAVGDKIEIMVEMHSMWDLPNAIKIAKALEEYRPSWFEDPIKMDNVDSLARFADSTNIPVTASETLGTRWSFRELLERGHVGIVMFDPTWVGGVSESKKIVSMAEAYQLPIAPHDCMGPVEFSVAVHISTNATNTLIQEVVRAYYTGWYKELVTNIPTVKEGYVYPLEGPGVGTELLPEVFERPDVLIKRSKLETSAIPT
jgi:galactonate dehydratase